MRLHPPALALALLLVPTGASADDELQLGQSRGDPIPVPADAPRLRAPSEPKAGGTQGRIFVNFDGAQLNDGWDDSTTNTTQIGQLVGNFAAYGNGAKRDATMQAVRDDWAPYNVIITETRPASGDYTMCMTGPTNPYGGGVLGIAPLDCNDSQTPNNIVYAFHSANDQFDASTQATTIGQEVAHSYGLEHVDEPGDVMNPYNAGGDPSFTDQCIGVVGGVVCGEQHAAECGSSNQQNSHRELLTLFGSATPDTASPTVAITAPADGATFDTGATFEITVEASDDVEIDQVILYNNDEEIESDGSSPYGWTVNDAPAGNYVFYVEAYDTAGNVSMSDTVSVVVGDAPAEDDGGGDEAADSADGGGDSAADGGGDSASDGGDGGDAGDDDGDGGGGEGETDGALPPDFGLDSRGTDQACACTSGRDRPAAWAGLLLLVGLVRRRR
jgi:MYXO-CTERM domain-containing protein